MASQKNCVFYKKINLLIIHSFKFDINFVGYEIYEII